MLDAFPGIGVPPAPKDHDWMIADHRWKLVKKGIQPGELYDLSTDADETVDLNDGAMTGEEQVAHDRLLAQIPS
jgi:hypothetical protein